MKLNLHIIMIEDIAADADLVERELRKGDWSLSFKRVETRPEFLNELEQRNPNVILSDHGLPTFDGFAALEIARNECPEVPFIFVTAEMGEQMALHAFESGATDYVLKDRIIKLVPAVKRALVEARAHHIRRQSETDHERLTRELQDALARIRSPSGLVPICASCKKIRDDEGHWKAIETFLREQLGATLTHGLCPDCIDRFYSQAEKPDKPDRSSLGFSGKISL